VTLRSEETVTQAHSVEEVTRDAAVEEIRGGAAARRPVKAAIGQCLYRSGLYRAAWRNRALIVLFHRVDDRYPKDPITCTRARFAAFCEFFTRYFIVVTLSELLGRMRRGEDISRRLVITFDDGYLDNYEFAATELRKRDLPACFFVAPGFLGTDKVAWWDARQRIRSEWMSWEQVRSMRELGFEIGSHTMSHADCGVLTDEDAILEIAGSKAVLEAEMRQRVDHFAFPYGGTMHMTPQNRSVVRAAGFSSCLAAHGGIVCSFDSPFHLRRVPINAWYTSPYHFGFETIRMAIGTPAEREDREASSAIATAG
jgi:peptidoglycan/xylan/chitin deacetylase (PgdA/CDA1 family)